MLGRLVRLAAIVGIGAWLVERRLGDRAAGAGPEPIRTTVDIDAPPDDVWVVLADIEAQPEWMHDLVDVEILGPLPVGVGTRAIGRVRDGRATRVTWDEVLAPPVLPHLGAFAIALVFRPIFEADLARLKALVERGEVPQRP